MKVLKVFLVLLVSLLVLAARAHAPQDTGIITGKVLDEKLAPIPSAQVIVVGTQRGALTDEHGAFAITAVPPGSRIVRAQTLGFVASDMVVVVEKGKTSVIEFKLKTRPIAE